LRTFLAQDAFCHFDRRRQLFVGFLELCIRDASCDQGEAGLEGVPRKRHELRLAQRLRDVEIVRALRMDRTAGQVSERSERATVRDQSSGLAERGIACVLDPELADDKVEASVRPGHVRGIAGNTLDASKSLAQLVDRGLRIVGAVCFEFCTGVLRRGDGGSRYRTVAAGHVKQACPWLVRELALEKCLPEMRWGQIACTDVFPAYRLFVAAPESVPVLGVPCVVLVIHRVAAARSASSVWVMYCLTIAARISSGTPPDVSMTSWKSRMSNASPSAASASRRRSQIVSSPIL
jgi:hypothetical protein